MVRSAMAFVAVVILAGFTPARQVTTPAQQVTTHTVVKGDCLWDLAQTYYGNPFQWRRIWNANRSRVSDPNYILPGWVLTIPPKEATVKKVTVESPAAPAKTPAKTPAKAPVPLPSVPEASAASAAHRPTVFRTEQPSQSSATGTANTAYAAVSRDQVYAAPWLLRTGSEPRVLGTLEHVVGTDMGVGDPHRFSEVRLTFRAAPPAVGTSLQLFRITKSITHVGRVATPSGVLRIETVSGDSAVALITQAYARIEVGDLVGPIPSYSLKPGEYAQKVSGGPEAMIVGFAGTSVVPADDQMAFLDQGSDDGVSVGDQYELLNPALGTGQVEGRLVVVGVTRDGATARIVQVSGRVLRQGVAVRLTRKMR